MFPSEILYIHPTFPNVPMVRISSRYGNPLLIIISKFWLRYLWPTRYLIFFMEVLYLPNVLMFCDLFAKPLAFSSMLWLRSDDHVEDFVRYKIVSLGLTSL